jgi:inhibitor of KinA
MPAPSFAYELFALGDTAITIDWGNSIDKKLNEKIIARHNQFRQEPLTGMIEVVPAYSSLTIYYDLTIVTKKIQPGSTAFGYLCKEIEKKLSQPVQNFITEQRRLRIPVCYEGDFAPDIDQLAKQKNISRQEIVRLHTSTSYHVYMMGFLPGFAYMGEVSEAISAQRKAQPVNIVAGSVGIAGRQTGIYPFDSPGGWQIIGRTPLKLFDNNKEDCSLLKTGDEVVFFSISKEEFNKIKADKESQWV